MNLHVHLIEMSKLLFLTWLLQFFITAITPTAVRAGGVILYNGKVWTGDQDRSIAEAVVIVGERIAFVGSNREAVKWRHPGIRMIDLQGKLVLPGFNDAHVHFSEGGFSLIALNLRPAKDRNDFARKIQKYAASLPEGAWITGGNWDHESWPEKKYPDRWLIDPVSGTHPVFVNRLDGHVAVANSLALKIAGITRDTPDPEGGYIERDPAGEPTGILKDTAMGLITRHVPEPPDSIRLRAVQAALRRAAEVGVTSVQDVSPVNDFHIYQQLAGQGTLTCRINAVMPIESHTEKLHRMGIQYHFGSPLLRIGGVKCFSDGSMGAGSALFFEPYADDPSTSGLAIYSRKRLMELIIRAHEYNLQVYCHAIGDKANHWVLDAFEAAIKQYGEKGLRHRIEHAQVVTEADFPRFARLNVIASMQPSHCSDDMRWAEKRIGKERCKNIYAFQSFLRAGVHLAFGTDWPVEPLNPMIGLYAAVTRELLEGGPEGGWFPEQKLSLAQAVSTYTLGSAYAEHEEQNKGTLEPGKLADLIVLDRDIFTRPPKEWLQTHVELTIMDGKVVFTRSIPTGEEE